MNKASVMSTLRLRRTISFHQRNKDLKEEGYCKDCKSVMEMNYLEFKNIFFGKKKRNRDIPRIQ